MSKWDKIFWAFNLFLVLISLSLGMHSCGYKSGQVDALTGSVKYELITHSDSTKTWEERVTK